MKNWQAIGKIKNQELREILIFAKGDLENALAEELPRYFQDNDSHRIGKDEFVNLQVALTRKSDVLKICEIAGASVEKVEFRGTCKGFVDDGMPYSENPRELGADFYRSRAKCGEIITHNNAEWIVVWNGYLHGDAFSFCEYEFIIAPVSALA